MQISVESVKEVRAQTSAGMMDCKKALEQCGGDIGGAVEALRQKGFAMAAKRADRAVGEGVVASYLHHNSRVGALLELNCETDFVARTDDFKRLAYDLAMHIVASDPAYLSIDEMPSDSSASAEAVCLLSQPFVRDPSMSVADVITEAIARTGENIRIGKFARIEVGC